MKRLLFLSLYAVFGSISIYAAVQQLGTLVSPNKHISVTYTDEYFTIT